MQRLPDYMRDMLSTRNPSDNWNKPIKECGKMTVAELITQLQKLDQSLRVVVKGYEGGHSDVSSLCEIPLRLYINTEWYYGKHEAMEFVEGEGNGKPGFFNGDTGEYDFDPPDCYAIVIK